MSDEVSKEDLKNLEERFICHEDGCERRHKSVTDRLDVFKDDIKDIKDNIKGIKGRLDSISGTLASIQAILATKRSTVVTWVSVIVAIGSVIWGMYASGYIDFPSLRNP